MCNLRGHAIKNVQIKTVKMFTSIIYTTIFVFSINVCVGRRYSNYTMYRAIPVNNTHVEFFSNLHEFYDINFWRPPGMVYKPVDFVIHPKDQPSFLRDANRHGLYLTTIIEDVQKAFDQQTVKAYIRREMESFDWNNYFRLDDIYHWLRDLANANPKVMQLQTIGKSYEDREIIAVKILLRDDGYSRSTIIIEGGIHAREWISPAFVTYVIHQILHADTSNDPVLKKVANNYEWYFIPVLNVDGYEYTHTVDRLWRKNMHGDGVDLNRNFGHGFGTVGVSTKTKSNLYCGTKAFSERESRALAKFIHSKSKNLEFYIATHSYGQYMILPYADSKQHQDNFDEVSDICKLAAQKISVRYGTKYEIGTAYDTVGYLSSGVSGCWVKSTFKTPYVITFELRDNGYDGFALPPDKILPTCKETMDGLLVIFDQSNTQLELKGLASGSFKICDTIVFIAIVVTFIMQRFN